MTMECENCGHAPESAPCQSCNEPAPLWAKFCPHCGAALARPACCAGDDPFALENRRLCHDENCIGIIGPDGRCTECHKPG